MPEHRENLFIRGFVMGLGGIAAAALVAVGFLIAREMYWVAVEHATHEPETIKGR